jgi:hypothetical protein
MIRRRSPNGQRSPSDARTGAAGVRTKVTSMHWSAIAGTFDRGARLDVTRIAPGYSDVTFGCGRDARQRTTPAPKPFSLPMPFPSHKPRAREISSTRRADAPLV